jgi:hypothetical protein
MESRYCCQWFIYKETSSDEPQGSSIDAVFLHITHKKKKKKTKQTPTDSIIIISSQQ